MPLNDLAQSYVHLVLAIGQHDSGYVDAYYGPAEWKQQAQVEKLSLKQVATSAKALVAQFDSSPAAAPDEALRQQLLGLHIRAAHAYVRKLMGETMTFDAESQALYDAVSPTVTEAQLDSVLAELSDLLPGEGALNARMVAFNSAFAIPRDKLDAVFSAAIAESRARTKQFIDLPDDESFRLEYVTNQVWSGYNWYLGNSSSLIQVNTDFPMQISRAIDLASHEGYPGHHVFHLLGEKHLVREKGWVEYCIFPLYSPLAFLSEGSANYGISVVFPEAERLAFERDVLFPLAGLDGTQVERYYQVQHAMQKLSYAGNMVAQRYLDGAITREAAIALLMKYSLQEEARAEQRIRFIEANRSYVINYNLGQDVVKAYVERRAGDGGQNALWQVFTDLLLAPRSASMMQG